MMESRIARRFGFSEMWCASWRSMQSLTLDAAQLQTVPQSSPPTVLQQFDIQRCNL